ncbi:unnamed protein product [Notodromas monacha]|uniref:small monomeric GTPase n=1 Tax=Notodromas monacha TaxID=399045 RepID=A0A7R9BX24_9CRUS|nr:unnamed protein product [Notodromas monacha]CAG0922196.1 unnamed protein product [Notodromas monacha]
MPCTRDVASLESLATHAAVTLVWSASLLLNDSDTRSGFRASFTDRLPSSLREKVLVRLNRRCGPHAIFSVFDMLVAASDPRLCVKRLRFFEPGRVEEKLWLDDVMALYRVLDRCNIAPQLAELSFAAKFDRLTEHYYVPLFNVGFPLLISKMAALTKLTMIGSCDDKILESLGKHCDNLTHVDVSESWQVTSNGVNALVYKIQDGVKMVNTCVPNFQVVSIKDTDVGVEGVESLLLHAKKLISLGGFFYGNNVGSVICSMAAADKELRLKLEDLYDVKLTGETAKKINEVCPNLTAVSTRADCVSALTEFDGIKKLSIDFDFRVDVDDFLNFVELKGQSLTKLEITDAVNPCNDMTDSVRRPPRNNIIKVVLLGDGGVGKSCLMMRYVSNRFEENSLHTLGVELLNKDITVKNSVYTLQIWDTAGQERFKSLRTPFYRGADICLLTFAVDERQSFDNLSNWVTEFVAYGDIKNASNYPFVVVANKQDLPTGIWEVTEDDIAKWCSSHGGLPYVLTSAKDATNVEAAFSMAVERWVEREEKLDKQFEENTIQMNSPSVGSSSCCS